MDDLDRLTPSEQALIERAVRKAFAKGRARGDADGYARGRDDARQALAFAAQLNGSATAVLKALDDHEPEPTPTPVSRDPVSLGLSEYRCPHCGGRAYNGDPTTGTRFRGSGACADCGDKFSIVGLKLKPVRTPDGSVPTEPPADPHDAIAEAMVEVAHEALEAGEDPRHAVEALRALLDDPAALARALGEGDADPETVAKAVGAWLVRKAWASDSHPRDDHGRFVSKDAIADAKGDAKKAAKLRERVTDPEQRKKLDAALSGETDLGRTKRGQARHEAGQRRADKDATRERGKEVLAKLTRAGDLRGDLTADDLHDLADHLQSEHVTVEHLREVRRKLQGGLAQRVGFGGAKAKADMVKALVAHARREGLEARMREQGVSDADAAEMRRAAGITPKESPPAPDREPTLEEMETGVKPGGGLRAQHLDPHSRPYPQAEAGDGVPAADATAGAPAPPEPTLEENKTPTTPGDTPKRPHEMSLQEWTEAKQKLVDAHNEGKPKRQRIGVLDPIGGFSTTHGRQIHDAIESGKKVPDELRKQFDRHTEDHELSQDRYNQRLAQKLGAHAPDPNGPPPPGSTGRKTWGDWSRGNDVDRALAQGKLVPPEVLADYPDLAAKHGKGTPKPAPRRGADDANPTEDEFAAASAKPAPPAPKQPAAKPDLLSDPKALADAVHAAGRKVPSSAGHDYDPSAPAALSHKPFISSIYDQMVRDGTLPAGTTLDQLKTALVAGNTSGHVTLARNDLPQIVPPHLRDQIARSHAQHPFAPADWHTVDVPHAAPARAVTPPAAPDPATDMAMLDQPANAVAPGSRTGDAAARKEAQRAKRSGVAKPKSDAHAAYLSASPKVKDYLESAYHNAGTTPEKAHAHKDKRDLATQLASAWGHLHADATATPGDRAAMESAILAHVPGIRKVGSAGEVVAFDPSVHAGAPGVFTGDRVKITTPGWVLPEDGKPDYRALKAGVERAGGNSPTNVATGVDKPTSVGNTTRAEPAKPAGGNAGGGKVVATEGKVKAKVPAGHAHAGELEGGAVVAKDPRSQALTTHFAPGEPERQARRLGKAIGDAMDYQSYMVDAQRDGGMVQIGHLVAEVKSRAPGATDSDVLAALSHLHKTRGLEAHAINEVRFLATKEGGTVPLYGSKDAATASLWEDGRARQYWMLPPGKRGRDLAAGGD